MDQLRLLALAVESAIWQSLNNAVENPDREEYWRRHADKLEAKFKNEHGRHYGDILYGHSQPSP